jgi:ferric-dicitrate binding protein FerR (iron transport regulator)
VKGTTFTVISGAQSAAVHVVEGAVEVASGVSGQSHLIRPGRTITVSPDGGDRLTSRGGGFKPTFPR